MKYILLLLVLVAFLLTSCSSEPSVDTYWACMDGCYDMQEICAEEFDFEPTYERQQECDTICANKYMS